jgi:hypothetical protein
MLNKDTEPWNGGYALTGKRKARLAISLFGTLFLVFFGVGFLMFRPHGIRGVLCLAVGVIVVFAASIALGEASSFLGRKLRVWTERMERATSSLGVRTADRHVPRGWRIRPGVLCRDVRALAMRTYPEAARLPSGRRDPKGRIHPDKRRNDVCATRRRAYERLLRQVNQ